MRKLFVVASSIQPRDGKFSYSKTRSLFSAEERFRQTFFTVNSIKNLVPEAKVVVVDSSDDYELYAKKLAYLDAEFIPIKELSGEVFETVNTHQSKSLCECLLLNTYFEQYKKEIFSYDYVIKTCGRYFYSKMDKSIFNEENTSKMFFKHPLQFKWNHTWNYDFVDLRHINGGDFLNQYCTVLYAFGAKHLHRIMDINEAAIHIINRPLMYHYDIETLSYYFTRPFQTDIIEVDWMVSGWDGTSGEFMYY